MRAYVIERPFVHLYLSNKKRFMIAYLDNYKAMVVPKDVPKPKPVEEEKKQNRRLVSGMSL